MTDRDMRKLIKAGFVLIRANNKKLIIEKIDSITPRWAKYEGPFKDRQEMNKRMRLMLQQRFIIQP